MRRQGGEWGSRPWPVVPGVQAVPATPSLTVPSTPIPAQPLHPPEYGTHQKMVDIVPSRILTSSGPPLGNTVAKV